VGERGHQFVCGEQGEWRRQNEIWQKTLDVRTGLFVAEKLITKNDARVCYEPESTTVSAARPAIADCAALVPAASM
jgi:hypothetical protein